MRQNLMTHDTEKVKTLDVLVYITALLKFPRQNMSIKTHPILFC